MLVYPTQVAKCGNMCMYIQLVKPPITSPSCIGLHTGEISKRMKSYFYSTRIMLCKTILSMHRRVRLIEREVMSEKNNHLDVWAEIPGE